MFTTINIVDRLNEWKGWTDYRVARMLEVSPQAVQHWRNKGGIMKDETAVKAAELLGLPAEVILSSIHLERARGTRAFDPLQKIYDMVEEAEKDEIKAAISVLMKAA